MFDNRLKDLRISKGFTSKDIAQMLDLKERTYKSYENNEREPDSKILVKIANLFDVSIDYLLDFDVNSIQSNTSLQFSTKEVNLVRAYRSKPDLQKAVDILLGIAESPPIVQTKRRPIDQLVVKDEKIACYETEQIGQPVSKEKEAEAKKLANQLKEREQKENEELKKLFEKARESQKDIF